jgi:SAM-dependent methyltransferase
VAEPTIPTAADGTTDWPQVAEFLGEAYLRNAFTRGSAQEIDFLWDVLGCSAGTKVLDAGCGPGRHTVEFARRGADVTAVDVAPRFVASARDALAAEGLHAEVRCEDLRSFDERDRYDVVVCLCQGGFGCVGGGIAADRDLVRRLATALRRGGRLALTSFSAFAAAGGLEDGAHSFDPASGLFVELATLRGPDGDEVVAEMTTACATPRELALFADAAGLAVDAVHGVEPGRYGSTPPTLDSTEFLLLAHRP